MPDLTVNYTIIDKSTGKESRGRHRHLRYLHADERFRWPALRRQRQARQGWHLPAEALHRIPASKGWMLHVDPETGVKGHFWTEPIEVTFDNWDYTPRQW